MEFSLKRLNDKYSDTHYTYVFAHTSVSIPGKLNQGCGSGFGRIPDPGLCTPNERRYIKYYKVNILDNYASLLFCFHNFGVGRSLWALDPVRMNPDPVRMNPDPDPGWFAGSRKSMERLTQKIKNYKKEN